jgi:hypothetical protein
MALLSCNNRLNDHKFFEINNLYVIVICKFDLFDLFDLVNRLHVGVISINNPTGH